MQNRAFADKFGFGYRLLCDTDRALATAYGALDDAEPDWPRRISYLIGPDQTIARAYDPVSPRAHPDQVLADLDALRAG